MSFRFTVMLYAASSVCALPPPSDWCGLLGGVVLLGFVA
jgi:hypothetical protein